jgi:hypothetical protein
MADRLKRQELVWHYSKGVHLERIMSSGVLRQTGVFGLSPDPERPVVWFSKRQDWEASSSMGIDGERVSMRENHEQVGLVRFGVDPGVVELHDFDAYVRLSGISQEAARGLVIAAQEWPRANPRDWLVSFQPVPREKWIAVQVWDGKRWTDWSEATSEKLYEHFRVLDRRVRGERAIPPIQSDVE